MHRFICNISHLNLKVAVKNFDILIPTVFLKGTKNRTPLMSYSAAGFSNYDAANMLIQTSKPRQGHRLHRA